MMDRVLRVLVVDDSAYVRKVIKQMLAIEVARGLITQDDLELICSSGRRMKWLASSFGDWRRLNLWRLYRFRRLVDHRASFVTMSQRAYDNSVFSQSTIVGKVCGVCPM